MPADGTAGIFRYDRGGEGPPIPPGPGLRAQCSHAWKRIDVNIARIALVPAMIIAPLAAGAQSANVNVVVNGTTVTFDQPPVEQAGRIYVPLRGVFERLGASVVYQNGQINATSGRHDIGLAIGSTTATVDGVQQTLDSPPFLIAGRTLVPLRFISQALGASVNFDQSSQTVYVTRGAAAAPAAVVPVAQPPPVTQPAAIALRLIRILPAPDSSINGLRPEIAATFAEPVDPNSVRVEVDGRDVTESTYVTGRSFVYDPTFDMPASRHEVVVSGRTSGHEPFRERWSFDSNVAPVNYLSGLEPPNGTPARLGFTISAFTKPGSVVSVVATTSETIAEFSEVAEGSIATSATADPGGYFAAHIALPERASTIVDVRIVSTAPDGTIAVRTLRLQR